MGATATGNPASGTFAVGDLLVTQDGKVKVCTNATGQGTWSTGFVATAAAVTGARDNPESALKNRLAALATLGIITDSTTTTAP